MKQYTAEEGFVYLDYFSHLADEKGLLKEEFSDDGVHPNSKGYEVMAPLAEVAISKALRSGK